MRILSLLPSATEIVFALGLEQSLVGVTAECDYPPAARNKPAVSFPTVGTTSESAPPSAAQIDGAVATLVASGEPLYRLDEERIRTLRPELILAQDLCRVCAVASGDVTEALERLGSEAMVLSLDPSTLDDVLATVAAVAEAVALLERPEIASAGVWALDGSAYFSRPGPRLVDGVELLAWVLHPHLVPAPPPGRARRLR